MSKFKVGDRVNWTKVRGEYDGSIIEAIGYSGVWPVTIRATNGNFTYVAFSELELAPRFAVGDKVRSKGAPEAGVAIVEYVKPEGGYRINFKDTWFGVCHGDDDDLTPTYTSCAAAEVDNMAAEYGAPAPWTEAKSKFKVGDRVRVVRHCNYSGEKIRMELTIGSEHTIVSETAQLANKDIPTFMLSGGDSNFYTPLNLEHVAVAPATATASTALTIEAGKFYKTRDGRKVGPMERNSIDAWTGDGGRRLYRDDGQRYFSCDRGGDSDLASEWTDEPAAKFKIGDRVRIARSNKDFKQRYIGREFTIKKGEYTSDGEPAWTGDGSSPYIWRDSELDLAAPTSIADIVAKHRQTGTAIVCLLENGKPAPATQPFVHASSGAAETEATRLANVHKGKEFGVYTLGAVANVERTYDHEWQRLAVGGSKINGIRELRAMTGLGLATAKDAVEDWLRREAA